MATVDNVGTFVSEPITLLVGGNNASTTFSGCLVDAMDNLAPYASCLTKVGTGTLTLTAGNFSYSGAIEIDAGVLRVGAGFVSPDGEPDLTINADDGLQFNAGLGTCNFGGLHGAARLTLSDRNGNPVTLDIGGPRYAEVCARVGKL